MFEFMGWPQPTNILDWSMMVIMIAFLIAFWILIGTFIWALLGWVVEFLGSIVEWMTWKWEMHWYERKRTRRN